MPNGYKKWLIENYKNGEDSISTAAIFEIKQSTA